MTAIKIVKVAKGADKPVLAPDKLFTPLAPLVDNIKGLGKIILPTENTPWFATRRLLITLGVVTAGILLTQFTLTLINYVEHHDVYNDVNALVGATSRLVIKLLLGSPQYVQVGNELLQPPRQDMGVWYAILHPQESYQLVQTLKIVSMPVDYDLIRMESIIPPQSNPLQSLAHGYFQLFLEHYDLKAILEASLTDSKTILNNFVLQHVWHTNAIIKQNVVMASRLSWEIMCVLTLILVTLGIEWHYKKSVGERPGTLLKALRKVLNHWFINTRWASPTLGFCDALQAVSQKKWLGRALAAMLLLIQIVLYVRLGSGIVQYVACHTQNCICFSQLCQDLMHFYYHTAPESSNNLVRDFLRLMADNKTAYPAEAFYKEYCKQPNPFLDGATYLSVGVFLAQFCILVYYASS